MCENQRESQRTYLLTICLKEGRGLVIRDRCGECQMSVYKHNTPQSTTHILIHKNIWCLFCRALFVKVRAGTEALQAVGHLVDPFTVGVMCFCPFLNDFFLPEFTL